MKKRFAILSSALLASAMLLTTPALADFEPSGNIEWYITSSPGGGSDIYTRKIIEIIQNSGLVDGTFLPTNLTDGGG